MKSTPSSPRLASALAVLCLAAGLAAPTHAQLPEGVTLGAAGWLQYSVIGKSSVRPAISGYKPGGLDGKSVLSPGAQLSLDAVLSERLRISAGIGVVGGNNLPAAPGVKGGYAVSTLDPFVSAANFVYQLPTLGESKFSITGGLFPYTYNPDAKNLGLYLLRGPVYPGILISGFETKHVLPVANMLGLQMHHEVGGFKQDLLISSDMEFYPFFDLSPAYVASYQVHPTFRIGGGVNFYHLISVDRNLTMGHSEQSRWKYVDSSGDTTNLGFNGTKLMVNASFDPKPLFGTGKFGSEDLKLYAEVALIGLNKDAAHEAVYGDYLDRMPVMFGFNLPVFNYLEHLSFEVEWYGADFEDNLDGYRVAGSSDAPTPYPTNWGTTPDKGNATFTAPTSQRDNWKWSLHGAKKIQEHVSISFQVANDHFRPGIFDGYADSSPPHRNAVLVAPKDWYLTTKLAYFF